MNLERLSMLAVVNIIKPALATKDLIEELTHIWFDGARAMAYNDAEMGISVPFKAPFKGGIRGALLFGLLHNSRAREVRLEPTEKEHEMRLTAGRACVDLTVLEESRSVWPFSKMDEAKAFPLTEQFLAGLKSVLVSVGNDISIPEKQGVTLIINADGIFLFTTDSKTMARVDLKRPKNFPVQKGRCILPTVFCEQLLRLCAKDDLLEIRPDCAIAKNETGVLIYSRLIHSESPVKFFDIFAREVTDDLILFDVPGRLSLALERALVILEGSAEEAVTVTLANGKLRIEVAVEGRGDLRDAVNIPEELPEQTCRINPELIKRALPASTAMGFGTSLYMEGENGFSYLAAYTGGG